MDNFMPNMDGSDAVTLLRLNGYNGNILTESPYHTDVDDASLSFHNPWICIYYINTTQWIQW